MLFSLITRISHATYKCALNKESMRPFRFKKHHKKSMNINVIVISEDVKSIIPSGWKYDVPPPPPFNKPKLPRRFLTKIKHPEYTGRVELSF